MKTAGIVLRERIDELCVEKGYSYYKLSQKSKVPLTTLFHIMEGVTQNPSFSTILNICYGFGITLEEFFDTEDFEILLKECE